jgi:hypothetical protein
MTDNRLQSHELSPNRNPWYWLAEPASSIVLVVTTLHHRNQLERDRQPQFKMSHEYPNSLGKLDATLLPAVLAYGVLTIRRTVL